MASARRSPAAAAIGGGGGRAAVMGPTHGEGRSGAARPLSRGRGARPERPAAMAREDARGEAYDDHFPDRHVRLSLPDDERPTYDRSQPPPAVSRGGERDGAGGNERGGGGGAAAAANARRQDARASPQQGGGGGLQAADAGQLQQMMAVARGQ